ncbi:hypothetical protein [Nocardia terpenica]|uniref:hypothetical protein n=1 Tax=Nocardia terpenica TaxID=455432 RepID=UPI0012FDFFBD|nr:hypothetical protein [Nocardia terpenica]
MSNHDHAAESGGRHRLDRPDAITVLQLRAGLRDDHPADPATPPRHGHDDGGAPA